jgi:hypothetical protein
MSHRDDLPKAADISVRVFGARHYGLGASSHPGRDEYVDIDDYQGRSDHYR